MIKQFTVMVIKEQDDVKVISRHTFPVENDINLLDDKDIEQFTKIAVNMIKADSTYASAMVGDKLGININIDFVRGVRDAVSKLHRCT